jgi:hypothetical protein
VPLLIVFFLIFQPKNNKALIISNNINFPEINIRFIDESVELVDNHKHLGVTFVSDGNWTNFSMSRS